MAENGLESTARTIITLDELYVMAAAYKGLKVGNPGSLRPCTPSFAAIPLTEKLINFLGTKGIEYREHSEGMYTLVDTGQQTLVPGWNPSNCWNQKTDGPTPPQIELYLVLGLNENERGITLRPQASGNFLSPSDDLPNFRMFRAIVESGLATDLLPVALEIASSDGCILVKWSDLGLDGLKRASELFGEFAGKNKNLYHLMYREEIFRPKPTGSLYFTESYQGTVLMNWHIQLGKYRESLRDMLPSR